MSGSTETTRFDMIVLARLLVAGKTAPTLDDLKKALEPLCGHRWAGAALTDQLDRALAELETAGLVSRAKKGKTERFSPTAEGRRRALEFLDIDHLPPKTNWAQVQKKYLAARALGLPTPTGQAATAFGGDPGFQAALLKAKFDLALSDHPKLPEALDALAWKLLGFEPGRKFSVAAVQSALIRRALGDHRQADSKTDPKKEVTKLLAREIGARQSGKDELRLAAIRRWVDGEPIAP